jgi:hypothetical protein
MQQLKALLGSDDWQLGDTSAERELANAISSISMAEAGRQLPTAMPDEQQITALEPNIPGLTKVPQDRSSVGRGSMACLPEAGLVQGLAADITAAAQKAAQDAISSSVQACLCGAVDSFS